MLTTNLSGEKAPGLQVGVEAMLGGVLVFVFREVGFAYFTFHGRNQKIHINRTLRATQQPLAERHGSLLTGFSRSLHLDSFTAESPALSSELMMP